MAGHVLNSFVRISGISLLSSEFKNLIITSRYLIAVLYYLHEAKKLS